MTMETRSFDVTVKNASSKPVTIWLCKDGPAWENGWKSPEDLAIEKPTADERINGMIVMPGESMGTGNMKGKFAAETNAILRVYVGQRKLSELLAMSRGNPDRVDAVLGRGVNSLVIVDNGPGIKVGPASGR